MVRPVSAQARPMKANTRLETPETGSPVGDGSWIQPAEEPIDSNDDDITIDRQVLNSMLMPTSMFNAHVARNQPEQAEAVPVITKSVVEPCQTAISMVAQNLAQNQPEQADVPVITKRVVGPRQMAVPMVAQNVAQNQPEQAQAGPDIPKRVVEPRQTAISMVAQNVAQNQPEQADVPVIAKRVVGLRQTAVPIIAQNVARNQPEQAEAVPLPVIAKRVVGPRQMAVPMVAQAQAGPDIPKRVVQPEPKAVERKQIPKPSSKPNISKTVTEPYGRKSPVPIPDSSYLEAKAKDEADSIPAVPSSENCELAETQTSNGNGNISTDFQVPPTNYFSSDYQFYPEGILRDIAAQGRDLYLRFLHEEMRVVRVREPPCMDPWRAARLDVDYSTGLNASVRIRKNLRQMANAFGCSEDREQVREIAARVDLETLNLSTFNDLLYPLFQEGGITPKRIIVLFYFCADLTIRALNEQLIGWFHQLIEWSQLYIVNNVSVWVQQNGGWAAVLEQSSNYIYKTTKIVLACTAIIALVIYIRKAR